MIYVLIDNVSIYECVNNDSTCNPINTHDSLEKLNINQTNQQDSGNIYTYEIHNLDTIIYHREKTSFFKWRRNSYDSTSIWCEIIFPNLPKKYNTSVMQDKVLEIMIEKNIDVAYVFKDIYDSCLFWSNSFEAYELLTERKGYLGRHQKTTIDLNKN